MKKFILIVLILSCTFFFLMSAAYLIVFLKNDHIIGNQNHYFMGNFYLAISYLIAFLIMLFLTVLTKKRFFRKK